MKRSLIFFGGLAIAGVTIWACVGDGSAPAQGADGGACTCGAGLVCTSPQGNGICIPAGSDATPDGPSDTGPKPDATQGDAGPDVATRGSIAIDASVLASLVVCTGTLYAYTCVNADAESCYSGQQPCSLPKPSTLLSSTAWLLRREPVRRRDLLPAQ